MIAEAKPAVKRSLQTKLAVAEENRAFAIRQLRRARILGADLDARDWTETLRLVEREVRGLQSELAAEDPDYDLYLRECAAEEAAADGRQYA